MRNNLDAWLQLLRIASFLTLIAAAWSIFRTASPLGITDQFQPILEEATGKFFEENDNGRFSSDDLQLYIQYGFSAFFFIAAFISLRCGEDAKPKYIISVFITGLLLVTAAVKHYFSSDFELISIIPFLLPIATPFLLLSYRRLANKVDHWNYYANFLCVTTIFGNALTYLFSPAKVPLFNSSTFSSVGIPGSAGDTMLTVFSYIAIFFALLTAFAITRRLGLFALIIIGVLSSIYRVLALSFSSESTMSFDLIIADFFFYASYWIIPILILLSLASRRKTQTLKL